MYTACRVEFYFDGLKWIIYHKLILLTTSTLNPGSCHDANFVVTSVTCAPNDDKDGVMTTLGFYLVNESRF